MHRPSRLTNEKIGAITQELWGDDATNSDVDFVRAIERAHHIGTTSDGEVQKDAKRLDWLEQQIKMHNLRGISFDYCRHVEDGHVVENGYRYMHRGYLGERQKTLRDVIDAAMDGKV